MYWVYFTLWDAHENLRTSDGLEWLKNDVFGYKHGMDLLSLTFIVNLLA